MHQYEIPVTFTDLVMTSFISFKNTTGTVLQFFRPDVITDQCYHDTYTVLFRYCLYMLHC